jgi:ethanolamine transporter EutH
VVDQHHDDKVCLIVDLIPVLILLNYQPKKLKIKKKEINIYLRSVFVHFYVYLIDVVLIEYVLIHKLSFFDERVINCFNYFFLSADVEKSICRNFANNALRSLTGLSFVHILEKENIKRNKNLFILYVEQLFQHESV